jgi:hypothetical protein
MPDIYGSHTYPESRRTFSRPYAAYFRRLCFTENEKAVAAFREALHEIGKEFIGLPHDWRTDVDRHLPRHFMPVFWHEDTVASMVETPNYHAYRKTLSEEGRGALDTIVRAVKKNKEDNKKRSDDQYIPYDVAGLTPVFKALWQADWLIDPRLTSMEELFFCVGDDSASLMEKKSRYIPNDEGVFEASLEWAAMAENAKRIAHAFLYSRLAQHYGETDPDSLSVVQKVEALIDKGGEVNVIATLRNAPETYMKQSVIEERREGFFTECWRVLCRKISPQQPQQKEMLLPRVLGLAESASAIVADYKRLRDGRWASEALDSLKRLSLNPPKQLNDRRCET